MKESYLATSPKMPAPPHPLLGVIMQSVRRQHEANGGEEGHTHPTTRHATTAPRKERDLVLYTVKVVLLLMLATTICTQQSNNVMCTQKRDTDTDTQVWKKYHTTAHLHQRVLLVVQGRAIDGNDDVKKRHKVSFRTRRPRRHLKDSMSADTNTRSERRARKQVYACESHGVHPMRKHAKGKRLTQAGYGMCPRRGTCRCPCAA